MMWTRVHQLVVHFLVSGRKNDPDAWSTHGSVSVFDAGSMRAQCPVASATDGSVYDDGAMRARRLFDPRFGV